MHVTFRQQPDLLTQFYILIQKIIFSQILCISIYIYVYPHTYIHKRTYIHRYLYKVFVNLVEVQVSVHNYSVDQFMISFTIFGKCFRYPMEKKFYLTQDTCFLSIFFTILLYVLDALGHEMCSSQCTSRYSQELSRY